MFLTISTIIKSKFSSTLPQISSTNVSKVAFIVFNVITGFIAATTFFITRGIQTQFSPLEPIISSDYENYLQIAIILAFVVVILTIFGCHCADIQSIVATAAYSILMTITFVGYLLFITYFLMFKQRLVDVIYEKFGKLTEFERNDIEGWLGCKGDECKDAVAITADGYLQQLVVICCVIIGCQLFCKFIGAKFLSDMEKEQKSISISYILNDFESSKQTFMLDNKV